ncbi:hypothetical protein GQ53DRAFT_132752 [Thozetella sp. PMI_491]|nr:hypothetical protein GQ53DRAFT_132752 [Thozetella sp. PMI_491]
MAPSGDSPSKGAGFGPTYSGLTRPPTPSAAFPLLPRPARPRIERGPAMRTRSSTRHVGPCRNVYYHWVGDLKKTTALLSYPPARTDAWECHDEEGQLESAEGRSSSVFMASIFGRDGRRALLVYSCPPRLQQTIPVLRAILTHADTAYYVEAAPANAPHRAAELGRGREHPSGGESQPHQRLMLARCAYALAATR